MLLGQRNKLENCCHILSLEGMRKWGVLRMHWKLCEDRNTLGLLSQCPAQRTHCSGLHVYCDKPCLRCWGITWSSPSRVSLNDGDTDESTGSPAKLSMHRGVHSVNTGEEHLIQGRLLREFHVGWDLENEWEFFRNYIKEPSRLVLLKTAHTWGAKKKKVTCTWGP